MSDEEDVLWVAIGDTWDDWEDTIYQTEKVAMSEVFDAMLDAGVSDDDIEIETRRRHGQEVTIMGYPRCNRNVWDNVYFYPVTADAAVIGDDR